MATAGAVSEGAATWVAESGSVSYAAHGGYGEHGGYSIVGYKSAGLGHADSAPGNGHSARKHPRNRASNGKCGTAMRVTHTGPYQPPSRDVRKPQELLSGGTSRNGQEYFQDTWAFCLAYGTDQRGYACLRAARGGQWPGRPAEQQRSMLAHTDPSVHDG